MKMILAMAVLVLSLVGASAQEDISPPSNGMSLMPSPHGNHGEGHDLLHPWYNTLKNQYGVSCCNNQDCRPTTTRTHEGKMQVMIDDEWFDADQNKILPFTSIDGQTHVCAPASNGYYEKGYHFCIVLGGAS